MVLSLTYIWIYEKIDFVGEFNGFGGALMTLEKKEYIAPDFIIESFSFESLMIGLSALTLDDPDGGGWSNLV